MDDPQFQQIIDFIRYIYNKPNEYIPLHEPCFYGNEEAFLADVIIRKEVASRGKYLDRFENELADFVGSKYAIAVNSGTSALHIALLLEGVQNGDEVITQPLSFVASANAISYCGAHPAFIDVDKQTLGLSSESLKNFIKNNCDRINGKLINKKTGAGIVACMPVHTYGFPCEIEEIASICSDNGLPLIEDAAEALGSFYKNRHVGTFGKSGIFSFNGNKTITAGGGGAIVTDSKDIYEKAKHLITSAKSEHPWQYHHDQVGFNYRMPNLNAALLCAQLENLNYYLSKKRELHQIYDEFFNKFSTIKLLKEPENTYSNYWLSNILLKDSQKQFSLLKTANDQGVNLRPVWKLLSKLPMYQHCFRDDLNNADWLEERIVSLPGGIFSL